MTHTKEDFLNLFRENDMNIEEQSPLANARHAERVIQSHISELSGKLDFVAKILKHKNKPNYLLILALIFIAFMSAITAVLVYKIGVIQPQQTALKLDSSELNTTLKSALNTLTVQQGNIMNDTAQIAPIIDNRLESFEKKMTALLGRPRVIYRDRVIYRNKIVSRETSKKKVSKHHRQKLS